MDKWPRILLALSVTLLAASFTPAGGDIAWGTLKPLGAIAFIAFFIAQLLAKEAAAYDQEHRRGVARSSPTPRKTAK